MDFLEALLSRVIPGDGAMGTLLFERGVSRDVCLEELCASAPELIQGIHAEYVAAGAQVIRTHSFGANGVRLARFGLERRVGELNWMAARIAREAVKGSDTLVAASVGPTGLKPTDTANRVAIFEEQLGGLLDGGAQLVIFETFTDLDELRDALEAKQTLHHCPSVALLAESDPARLATAFTTLRDSGADVVGINCSSDPDGMLRALANADTSEWIAAFPSAGLPGEEWGQLRYPLSVDAFAEGAKKLVDGGVRFIGGCCGTTPAHIAAMVARLYPEPRS